jgi:hypothetical protein
MVCSSITEHEDPYDTVMRRAAAIKSTISPICSKFDKCIYKSICVCNYVDIYTNIYIYMYKYLYDTGIYISIYVGI